MRVIRRGDNDRVDVLVHLVEHHSEVIEERLRGSPVLHVFRAMVAIDITEGDEVFLAATLLIGLPRDPSAGTDERDVHLAIRGRAGLADRKGWKDTTGGSERSSRGGKKGSSIHSARVGCQFDILDQGHSLREE
jgi:hypothetical protein